PELEFCLVVPPGHPVDAGRGITLQRVKCQLQCVEVDMVEECGEPLLGPLPCDLPYAVQPLGHTIPDLRPVRALLRRVPLGPRPWLHRLRPRSRGLVHRLPCYYGGA